MPIAILCPCSAKLRVADHLIGQRVQCPRCEAVYDVVVAPANNGYSHATAPAVGNLDDLIDTAGLSPREAERLREELQPGEQLVWAGKPIVRSAFLMGWAYGSIFFFQAVMFVIFAVIIFNTMGGAIGYLFALLAVVMLVAGFGFPFWSRHRYVGTAYALTNKRALVWEIDWFLKPQFHPYGPEDVAQYARDAMSVRPDAVGHIVFAREFLIKLGEKKIYRYHGFFYLRELPALEKLLRAHLIDPYTDRLLK